MDQNFPIGTPITSAHPSRRPADQLAQRHRRIGEMAIDLLGLQESASDPGVDFDQVFTQAIEKLKVRPAATAQPHIAGWIYEDELPESYPYDIMYPYSKVDVVRLFPVFVPSPSSKYLNLVDGKIYELISQDGEGVTFRREGRETARYLGKAEFDRRFQIQGSSPSSQQPSAKTPLHEIALIAKAANPGPHHIYTHPRDDNNWKANAAFHEAITPQLVISLIEAIQAESEPIANVAEFPSTSQHAVAIVEALVRLAEYGVPTDIQEALVHGSATYDIRPGALAAALSAPEKAAPQTHVTAVSREDTIKFLEIAIRNWSDVQELSASDITDVTTALQWFLGRQALAQQHGESK